MLTLTMKSKVSPVIAFIAFGTMCWVIAFIVALAMSAEAKIIWTCVSGIILGVTGIRYTLRRARRSGI